MAQYANWKSGEVQTFVSAGSNPARVTQSSVGWALGSPSGCKPPATRCAGSTPARRTLGPFVYRLRMAAPQAAGAGSIPARVTSCKQHDRVMELVDMRRSERRALSGVGVRLSPWSLRSTQASQRSSGPHKPGPSGATPEPAT
jgi:hypothetical protein